MKKKKLLYSQLTPAPAPPPKPAASAAKKAGAPVELARALAAAQATEQASAPAPAPAAVAVQAATPAPAQAPEQHVAHLVTPMRGMPRITPLRGMTVIKGGAPAPAAAPAPRSLRDRVRARTGKIDLLLFRVANERFGLELGSVEEAIDLPPVHHVPEMPPSMLGVITVRGTLTPVYSPQVALGLDLTDGASALIFKRGRQRFALVIDDVEDVASLDLTQLRDAPGLDDSEGIVLGVIRQRDTLLALVDTESLLATCQAVPLLEIA